MIGEFLPRDFKEWIKPEKRGDACENCGKVFRATSNDEIWCPDCMCSMENAGHLG